VLSFEYPDRVASPREHGTWLRALLRWPKGTELPALPPISHLMLNTVDGANLHEFRMEKFSGLGVPHQSVKLRRSPLFLHSEEEGDTSLANPDQFPDLRVFVVEEDGERREWRRAPGNSLLTASKCAKSKRKRSGDTREPACFTCSPRSLYQSARSMMMVLSTVLYFVTMSFILQ
jgi:hypothetical protein